MKLIRKFKRLLYLRRHRSTVPTGLVPLTEMHSVTVYMDLPEDISEPQKTTVLRFFKQYGIAVSWLFADDEELRSSSDLFISLALSGDINETCAAKCSCARFKVGRHQLKGEVYDFVVTDKGPDPSPAMEAYEVIVLFLQNIK